MIKTLILAATIAAALNTATYAQTASGAASASTSTSNSGGATITIASPAESSGGVRISPPKSSQGAQQPSAGGDTGTKRNGTVTPPRR